VTKVTILENASQKVIDGDSIKPIVFYRENALEIQESNFPGGYQHIISGDTVTIIGLIQEGSKGLHDFLLSAIGPENQATAKATIEVIPAKATLDVIEGCDNQEVIAGGEITPVVYKYAHVKSIDVKGLLAGLEMEQEKGTKQVKIYGTVDSKLAIGEYVYTFELTDFYGNETTVTGNINVVETLSKPSAKGSSVCLESKQSSSSEAEVSSSSVKNTSSSSGVEASSSSRNESNSSEGESSSSEERAEGVVAGVKPYFGFGYANNELLVVLPRPSTVRVQVFDLMGHLVESFSESVGMSGNFSLARLKKGNYVVRVESNRFTRTMKVVVK
jgi:hypothetical protein